MEIISAIAVVSCFSSPVLFAFAALLGFLYFKEWRSANLDREKFENKIKVISKNANHAMRESWLIEVKDISFNSELEVETKFVYPLLRYLGYAPYNLRMRLSVSVPVGRQKVAGIADWVVCQSGKPIIIVEAKDKSQSLNEAVQEQARSYCFALNCPTYILTNGQHVQVYRRGLDVDRMVFNCRLDELSEKWGSLYEIIGLHD